MLRPHRSRHPDRPLRPTAGRHRTAVAGRRGRCPGDRPQRRRRDREALHPDSRAGRGPGAACRPRTCRPTARGPGHRHPGFARIRTAWPRGPEGTGACATVTPGRTRGPEVLADLARYEALQDPDQDGPDSNPTGFALTRDGVVVTDSGGNTLLRVRPGARTSTLAVFGERLFPASRGIPADPGRAGGTDPDGRRAHLGGAGPGRGALRQPAHRLPVPGRRLDHLARGARACHPRQYATGLTNVTDLAWHRGSLYAVQLSDVGLAAEPGLPTGSLRRIDRVAARRWSPAACPPRTAWRWPGSTRTSPRARSAPTPAAWSGSTCCPTGRTT